MIEYVIAHSPDDRVLKRASKLLNQGDLVCFPTDTSWVLACCVHNKKAIDKLYKIKDEGKEKHFSLLSNDISKASEVALIDNSAFKILKRVIPGHYTFIFEARKKIAKQVQASKIDKEVGVRFVPSHLVNALIDIHGDVLLTTNIPNSLIGQPEDSQETVYSYQLEDTISNIVSMIIDPGEIEFSGPSTIISFCSDEGIEIIREGAGDTAPFL